MYRPNFIINNDGYDASTHFDLVINSQMDQAADNGRPFVWTITFIKTDATNSRISNTPLQIKVPIFDKYPGYTREEAVRAMMCYIRKQIKQKANEIISDNTSIKAKSNADAIDFFSKLDLAKGLDVDGSVQEMREEYFETCGHLVEGTKNFIAQRKQSGKGMVYENIEVDADKQKVYLLPFIINNDDYDASTHFDLVIYDKIKMANEMGKPIMFMIDFIKTDSMNATAANTPIEVIAPILPIKDGVKNPKYRQITRNQKDILMQYIRSEIERRYQEITEDKNPAAQKGIKQIVEFLKGLDICKDIDMYDSEKMIESANQKIAEFYSGHGGMGE
ncbi:MAG: hypothetical protein IKD36_02690 [Clostridia bacterium]|nr:hypothetical protein [Clostridia bacterium]